MSQTLYEKYGGEATVATLVENFYCKVLQDTRIKDFFQNTDMERQHRHQTAFIAQALGGPSAYPGADMRKAHAHLDIDESHFMAVAELLQATRSRCK